MVPELFLLFDFVCNLFGGQKKAPATAILPTEKPSPAISDSPTSDSEPDPGAGHMHTISEVEAIRIAAEAVTRLKCNVTQDEPKAIYKQRHMRLGKNRSGWLVIFKLDVPPSFEPDRLYVEVCEPDGEVYLPENL